MARGTADGTGLSLPITLATVTYVKPAIGSATNDPIGFNIQAEQAGPALYVAVDPAMLSPTPAVGDVVSFTITELSTLNGLKMARAVTGFSRSATGVDVNPLVQDLTAATDIVTALGNYESELFDLTGSVSGAFIASGTGFERAPIATTGIASDANFVIRIPSALRSSIDLVTGCSFTLNNVPVFRFNALAQMPAYVASDITVSGCPASRSRRAKSFANGASPSCSKRSRPARSRSMSRAASRLRGNWQIVRHVTARSALDSTWLDHRIARGMHEVRSNILNAHAS